MKQKSKRRLIREKVLQVLFAYEMNNESLQFLIDEIFKEIENDTDLQFGNEIINKIRIQSSVNFKMERRVLWSSTGTNQSRLA